MNSRPPVALGLVSLLAFAPASAQAPRAGQCPAALSALLKKQTQAFSDAGQAGDAKIVDRYLDPDVVFTNETGNIATKKDIVDGTPPPPVGAPTRTIDVTNWALHCQGVGLATSTFIDSLTQSFHGQALVLRFQSTETWAKRGARWTMIVSHTMNVQRDPVAIALPSSDLDAYVGTYQLDPTYVVKIARAGDTLSASANGATPIPLKVEVKDVLFTPGYPNVRRIFQRDPSGMIVGYITRRDGADLVLRKVS
jgi:hypothetical protein